MATTADYPNDRGRETPVEGAPTSVAPGIPCPTADRTSELCPVPRPGAA